MTRRPLSLLHPWLYALRVWQRRCFTHIAWQLGGLRLARTQALEPLKWRYFRHSSKLIRRLGDSDQALQLNKAINLKKALPSLDGILIEPGQTFSFCRLVGRPTRERGFVEGMELSFGRVRPGIGGGLCQISNLIHWMALHSPLQVTARSPHSFDPFPDDNRVLPFGSGAAIFYNFIDLKLHNPTNQTFQLKLWMTDNTLEGDLRSDQAPQHKYHVYEKNNGFARHDGAVWRRNEIWRTTHTKGHLPVQVEERCLYKNNVRVMYAVPEDQMQNSHPPHGFWPASR